MSRRAQALRRGSAQAALLVGLLGAAAPRAAEGAPAVPGPASRPDYGVLILSHGGSSAWNHAVLDVRKALASKFPVEVAFGMADSREIQRAIDRLLARRVKKIVAVPLFISSHSEVIEQTKFVLGMRKEPSEEFMDVPHAHRGHTIAKRVDPRVPVVMTPALDDNPLVAEILLDRAREMSRQPAKEALVLVGHGPLKDEDNELWLRYMNSLADRVKRRGGFASVHAATLRDDSPDKVQREAERKLRALVSGLSRQGRVLVVPHLIAAGGIERHVVKALDGLFYEWKGKTLLPDPRISRWVEINAQAAAAMPDMRQYKDPGRALPAPERQRIVPVDASKGAKAPAGP